MAEYLTKFWRWFFYGSGGKPGYRRLVNRWLFAHIAVGTALGYLVKIDLQAAANTVLLPLAGILVGLSFAWAGNAQALMQTPEIDALSGHRAGGFTEYVYTYQIAILTILVTLVLWAFAGLKIYDDLWPTSAKFKTYLVVKAALFTFSSLTLRECWHVVLAAQLMLLSRREIGKSITQKQLNSSAAREATMKTESEGVTSQTDGR